MKLNLREIIEIPGGSVPFAQELDTALLERAGLLDRVDRWLALCAGAEA